MGRRCKGVGVHSDKVGGKNEKEEREDERHETHSFLARCIFNHICNKFVTELAEGLHASGYELTFCRESKKAND